MAKQKIEPAAQHIEANALDKNSQEATDGELTLVPTSAQPSTDATADQMLYGTDHSGTDRTVQEEPEQTAEAMLYGTADSALKDTSDTGSDRNPDLHETA